MSDEKVETVCDVVNSGEQPSSLAQPEPPILPQITVNPTAEIISPELKSACVHPTNVGVPLLLKDTHISTKVDSMYADMAAEIHKTPLTKQTLWPTVLRAMERIDTVKEIQGVSKKEWVLSSMQNIVKRHPKISEDDRVALLQDLVTLVPPLLDEFMKVAKGVYKLASEVQATGCFGCCSVKSKKLKMQK